MYKNFILKKISVNESIAGYLWDIEEPKGVICIIHGIGEYAGRYNRVAEKFNNKGFAVISMDLKGHGLSYGKKGHCAPRLEVLESIDELLCYTKKMYLNVPLIIYGHSMGGNIALDYRNRGNKNDIPKGYIISAPWIELVRKVPKVQVTSMRLISKVFPKLTIKSKIDEIQLGNLLFVKGYNSDRLTHEYISAQCVLDGFDIGNALANGEHKRNNNPLKPMLLMHGDADVICSIEGSKNISLQEEDLCEFVIWPDHFHEIHNGGKSSEGEDVISKAILWAEELLV